MVAEGMSLASLLGAAHPLVDLAGTVVFALSGALAAARAGQTPVTFAFFAVLTGVGGGTVRDLLIGAPVFWVFSPWAAAACLVPAAAVWLAPARWWPERAIDWSDAAGIAWYGVYGSAKALEFGVPPLPAAIMGVVSASAGGIMRDVLAGTPSIIMRPEIYVTAIALSAFAYVLLAALGVPPLLAAGVALFSGFGLRALAILKGLALPAYKG